MTARDLPLRIVLVEPPRDVTFGIQTGRTYDVVQAAKVKGKTLAFDFTVEVKEREGELRLYGPLTQGGPKARFVYVNCGTLAGDEKSCWTRRAKVSLMGITRAAIEKTWATKGGVLEIQIAGTNPNGSPVCASTKDKVLDGWKVAKAKR